MTGFMVGAAILIVITLAILLPPLWRAPTSANGKDPRQANIAVLRDQLRELERERTDGLLAEADFHVARAELQRRLLDETAGIAPASTVARPGRGAAMALLVMLPLAATTGYLLFGNPRALDPLLRQSRLSPEQIEAMVTNLAEKLQKHPDDAQGWIMLARSYKVLERFERAAEAYDHARSIVDHDAALLADNADVLSRSQSGNLQGRPWQLIERALQINPEEPQALLLAGAAASERGQFTAAAEYWNRLLVQIEPGTEEERALTAAIARAEQLAAVQAKGGADSGDAVAASISGVVSLSDRLTTQALSDDVLFVFVRSEDGARAPIAALRARVRDLPLQFRFDDSMALIAGQKLSAAKSLTVEARIAKTGQAQSAAGDLYGRIRGVRPGSSHLALVIDRVQP